MKADYKGKVYELIPYERQSENCCEGCDLEFDTDACTESQFDSCVGTESHVWKEVK